MRAFYEDQLMARQRPVGHDPQHGATISALALNWIKMDELLNPDTFFASDNPADKARMESLREKLQKVADDENNALNVLPGAYFTAALEALEGNNPQIPSTARPMRAKRALSRAASRKLPARPALSRPSTFVGRR